MDKLWFEGSIKIDCVLKAITESFDNIGENFVGIIGLMPGMKSVELLDQGSDFVTIKTNEGKMRRTNISKQVKADKVVLEFDEEYKAGRMITTKSHNKEEFNQLNNCVKLHIEITGVGASGILGLFYSLFGSKNIGNSFLNSYKKYFEK